MSADADPKTQPVEVARPEPRTRFPPPQLRIHDRQVYVGFGATPLGEGLTLADLALIVPDVAFPFDIAGSAATRYQKKKCRFGYLDLQLDHDLVHRAVLRTQGACAEHVGALSLHLRAGRLEGEGLLHAPGGPTAFTFRVGFQPEGTSVLAAIFDVRLYGPTPVPAPFLAALLARGARRAQAIPSAQAWGAIGLTVDPVPGLLRLAVPLRGFRLPEMGDARLARVDPGPRAFHLHFAANARPDTSLDEGLLTSVEGTRSFAEGEALLAQGDLAGAEAFYLRRGEAPDAHPFAQERLLGLLAARNDAHDLALDLARAMQSIRPGAAAAHWVEATIRLERGEWRASGQAFLRVAALARERGEEASAFHAFAAAGRALAQEAPAQASRALQDALVSRPDDLGCLLALATAADRARDAEGAMRAYKRIAALARDPQQAARAHVRLAGLLLRLTQDSPTARLHFDAALRLSPDDPEALLGFADLCRASGEPLRALRALDQLRRAAIVDGNPGLEASACLRSGVTWEESLGHDGNALLRYQEAAALSPSDAEPALRMAALYERTARPAEALEAWQQVLVLAEAKLHSPAEGAGSREAAHRARHALARIARDRLGDPAAALAHLEAAVALVPEDATALRALLPSWREAKRSADLARGCERCAALAGQPEERAALLAEAGSLLAGTLAQPHKAERLLEQALLVDADCAPALAAMADLSEARGDGPALCRFLRRLCDLAQETAEKVCLLLRLSRGARDLAQDLDLAADALARALELSPDDLPSRAELCALQRRRGDPSALAAALAGWTGLLESDGQFPEAARALLEHAELLNGPLARPDEAFALLERAMVLSPEDAAVLRALARMALDRGKPATAREALRSLLAALPQSESPAERAELLALLGIACEALGDRAGALDATATAFADRSGDDALGERLETLLGDAPGRALDVAGVRLARARAARDGALPARAAGHFLKAARLFEQLGDARGAVGAFEGALDADPDGPTAPEVLEALVRASLAASDAPRASELVARRAAFEPQPRAAARLLHRAAALAQESSASLHRALLARSLARDESYPPARASMALLHLSEGGFAQALVHAQAALAQPSDPDALPSGARVELERVAARAAREVGDLEASRAHLTRYHEARPDDAGALSDLVALHRRLGDRAELLALLPALASRSSGAASVEALRELAFLLVEDPSRRAEGAGAFRSALALDPDDVASLEGLTALLTAPEEAAERVRLLGRLVDLVREPDQVARLFVEAGEALLGAGRSREAVDAFEKAARVSAEPGRALERLAAAARAASDKGREVAALLKRARLAEAQREADAPERQVATAIRLLELGRAADAEPLLARALAPGAPEPVHRDALQVLIELEEERGELLRAAEHLARLAERLKGSEKAAVLARRAEHQRASGKPALARESLRDALQASPGDRRAILALKAVCAELGDEPGYATALEALLALPQADRSAAGALCEELADLQERLGDRAAAERSHRRALALDRSRVDAAQGLYRLLIHRGELEEAVSLGQKLAARATDEEAAFGHYAELARVALHGLGDRPRALGFARRADERDPSDVPNALLLAESLYLSGATAEALAVHLRLLVLLDAAALEDDPERARELRLRLAELSAAAGDVALSASTLSALLDEEPHRATAAERLFELLRTAEPANALEALARHARALAPSRRAGQIFFFLAHESRRRGDPRAAAQYLELARPSAEDLFELERARADALREAGLVPELVRALRALADQARARAEPTVALAALDELAAHLGAQGEPARQALAHLEAADLASDLGERDGAADRLLRRGTLLRDLLDEPAAAEQAFLRAFELAPGQGEAARLAAELCSRRGDRVGQAALVAASAPLLREKRERAQAWLELSRLRAELADAPAAEAAAREALTLEPSLREARLLLEQLLEGEGRFAELAVALEAHAALEPEGPPRLSRLLRAGRLQRDQVRDAGAASRALVAALALSPDDLALAEECAGVLQSAGRDPEARALDERILAADALRDEAFARQRRRLESVSDAASHAALLEARAARSPPAPAIELLLEAARLRASSADLPAALADERRAFEVDSRNDGAFAALVSRLGTGAPATLSEVLRARAEAVPGEALELHRERAMLLGRAGDPAGAAQALEELLALAPGDGAALASRAELAQEFEGPEAAQPFDERLLEGAARGVEVSASAVAKARLRLGGLAERRGDAAAAAAHLRGALEGPLLPERADEALETLAGLYQRLEDKPALFGARMIQFARAKTDEARLDALERALFAAPDEQAELATLTHLCRLRPGDASLQARRAQALEAARDFEAAGRAWETAAAATGERLARAQAHLRAASAAERSGARERAHALRLQARADAPSDRDIARACLPDLREEGERTSLLSALALLADSDLEPEAELARLERARLLDAAPEPAQAAAAFLDIAARGSSTAGFAEACARARALFEALGQIHPAAEALTRWAEAQPGEAAARAYLDAAQLLDARADDPDGAILLLERATTAAPSSPSPWAARAALHDRRGQDLERARALYEQARRTPDGEHSLALLTSAAELFLARGRPEALEALRAAVLSRPNDAALRIRLVETSEALGDLASAFDELEPPRRLLSPSDPRWLSLTRRGAALARSLGRSSEATRLLVELFERDPSDAEAFAAARALLAPSSPARWLAALEAREKAVADLGAPFPERATLSVERAEVLVCLGQSDEARSALRESLRLWAGCRAAADLLRALAERAQDDALLAEALEAQASCAPDPALRYALLTKLGEVLGARLALDARAAAAFEAALGCAASPEQVAASERALAHALVGASSPARALEVLSRRLADPEDGRDPGLRELAAAACLQLEDRTRARAYLLAALELAPSRDSAFTLLAELAADAPEDLGAALLARARAASPGELRASVLREAAGAFNRAEATHRAEEALRASLVEEPGSRESFLALGALLEAAGRTGELREVLVQRLGLAPKGDEPRALLVRLARLEPSSDPVAALRWLERAFALEPSSEEVRALTREACRRAPEAELEAHLDRLESGPAAASVAALCLDLASDQGASARALALLRRAVRLEPDLRPAHEAALRTARALGDRARALEATEGLLPLEPDPAARARLHCDAFELGTLLGRPALDHLRKAAALAPETALLRRLAGELRASGDASGAVEALLLCAGLEADAAQRRGALLEAADLQVEALRAPGPAISILERALDGSAADREVLERIAQLARQAGDPAALIAAAERLEPLAGPSALLPLLVPLGRSLAEVGRLPEALARLQQALKAAWDPSLALEVRALSERAGDLDAFSQVELSLIAALTGEQPAQAAERLRSLATRLQADVERAADLLDRAHALSPCEADLEKKAELFASSPARALGPLGQLARARPAAADRRSRLEAAVRATGDTERADLLASADTFLEPNRPVEGRSSSGPLVRGLERAVLPPSLEGVAVDGELRASLYDPLARGALAQLLRSAAGALGRAFADDLTRLGLAPQQRLSPLHGAALFGRVLAAQRAVGLGAVEAWLDPRRGAEIALVPGDPDRLVIGLGAAAGLDSAALAFLLLRACELSGAGAAVALQAGPDLPMLVRCVLSACGEQEELSAAFAGRVGALRSALPSQARGELSQLSRAAREELSRVEPAALLDALVRSAGRVAMVALGDAGAGLRATVRSMGAEPAALDLPALFEHSSALKDLLEALLRDDLGALRRRCRGTFP